MFSRRIQHKSQAVVRLMPFDKKCSLEHYIMQHFQFTLNTQTKGTLGLKFQNVRFENAIFTNKFKCLVKSQTGV